MAGMVNQTPQGTYPAWVWPCKNDLKLHYFAEAGASTLCGSYSGSDVSEFEWPGELYISSKICCSFCWDEVNKEKENVSGS